MNRLVIFIIVSFLVFPFKLQAQAQSGIVKEILLSAKENNRKDDQLMYQLADSAEKILLDQHLFTDQLFEASYLKSRVLVRQGKDIEAISYLEDRLNTKKEITEHVAQNHLILGIAYRHISDQEKTILHYGKAIQYFDSLQLCDSYVKAKNNLGNYYNATSRYELALDNYKTALNKLEDCKDNYPMAILERNIAGVYFNYFKDLDRGEIYFKNALNSFAKLDTTDPKVLKSLIGARISLGLLLTEKKSYPIALSIFKTALQTAKSNGLLIREIESQSGLAKIYGIQGYIDSAINNYQEAIRLAEKKSYNYLLGNLYTGIAQVYLEKNQLNEALSFLKKALIICDQNNYLQEKSEALLLLSKVYKEKGHTEEAYLTLAEYSLLKDQIFNKDNNRKIKAKKSDIELIKKDQEIKILRLEQENKEALNNVMASELRSKNILVVALLCVLILALFIAISVVKNRHKKVQISALELEQQKAQLEHNILMNQKLEEIKLFKTAIASKKEEQDRISKDLHDNIGATLAAIKLSLNNGQTDTEEILPFLDNVYNHVRDLSHHLASISKEQVDFEDIIKGYIEKMAKISNIEMHFEVIPSQSLLNLNEQYQAELFSIVREGLNNAIKHSETNELEVVITRDDEAINLYIEDHGKGFEIQQHVNGIGLSNIEARVQALGGSFEIDTHPKRGVILNISIPYDTE